MDREVLQSRPFQKFDIREIAKHMPRDRHQDGWVEEVGKHEPDVCLVPLLRGEIDSNKRAEAGLDIGNTEDEPIQTTQGPLGRSRRRGLVAARSPFDDSEAWFPGACFAAGLRLAGSRGRDWQD